MSLVDEFIEAFGRIRRRFVAVGGSYHAEIVAVVNPDGSPIGGATGGSAALTDDQLRAAPVLVSDKSSWVSETVVGRMRDPANDVVTQYGDGTSETLYFTAEGEYAGKSQRS